jgi:hypothetical protein
MILSSLRAFGVKEVEAHYDRTAKWIADSFEAQASTL